MVVELKAAGFTALELRAAKFRASELRSVGFHAKDLHEARFRAVDLKNALACASAWMWARRSAAKVDEDQCPSISSRATLLMCTTQVGNRLRLAFWGVRAQPPHTRKSPVTRLLMDFIEVSFIGGNLPSS